MGQKKLVRKAEPPSKRGIAWPRWTGFRGKTVWDWLPIVGTFLVPLVIVLGTGWISWQLAKLENQRAQQAQKIENQRAEAERELAEQRAQDEALQEYLTQMGTLMLEKNLRESEEDSEVRALARARTLTVLPRLDGERKARVLQFLYETDLIIKDRSVVNLRGADLSDANLRGLRLNDADLSHAYLSHAYLSYAYLRGADLSTTDLSYAKLSYAILLDANLRSANLRAANLQAANLRYTDLSDANLSIANFFEADLTVANLNRAEGIPNEVLDRQAASLEGVTMPNGQKYEAWLKSEGRDWQGGRVTEEPKGR